MIDVLLPLRPGENNELKFALRSLEQNYLPGVRRLYVVGSDLPAWLTDVTLIDGNLHDEAALNVYDNIRRGCRALDHLDRLLIINDDFYLCEPAREFLPAHRCTLSEHLGRIRGEGWWSHSLAATSALLGGDALSHELHRPIEVDPKAMADLLDEHAHIPGPIQWRSLYGNRFYEQSWPYRDGKMYGRTALPVGVSVLSSSDRGFQYLVPKLREWFPEPSRWEALGKGRSVKRHDSVRSHSVECV